MFIKCASILHNSIFTKTTAKKNFTLGEKNILFKKMFFITKNALSHVGISGKKKKQEAHGPHRSPEEQ